MVPGDRRDRPVSAVWYLPHHPVLKANKPGKVPVVFDCTAWQQGTSLNDQLLQGPDLRNNLVGVLTCFRQEPVALMADVELFHQVSVSSNDCDALRFLWWPNNDLNSEPEEYQMMVHLFGATSSPSCANFSVGEPQNTIAKNLAKKQSTVSKATSSSTIASSQSHRSGERALHTSLKGRVPLDKMDLQFPKGHRFYSTFGKSRIREESSLWSIANWVGLESQMGCGVRLLWLQDKTRNPICCQLRLWPIRVCSSIYPTPGHSNMVGCRIIKEKEK